MKRLTDHHWANTVFVLRSVLLQLDAHFVRSAIEFGNNTINSLLVLMFKKLKQQLDDSELRMERLFSSI